MDIETKKRSTSFEFEGVTKKPKLESREEINDNVKYAAEFLIKHPGMFPVFHEIMMKKYPRYMKEMNIV